MKPVFTVCYGVYSSDKEDTSPFNKPGWSPAHNSTNRDELFRLCPKPWRYQQAEDTDTVPKWGKFSFYPGGGFVSDLGYKNSTGFGIIKTLQNQGWLDRQTRAVIVEFSTFNPTVNLLAVCTYFFEIHPSGYGALFERIEVVSVYSTETASHQFYLICILLFIIFVFIYFGKECYKLYRQRSRYFKSIWNWVEIFLVLVSLLAVVMHVMAARKTASTIQKMQENVYANTSFQEAVTWVEAENAALGILTFIGIVKLLRLMRFNDQVAVFSRTLRVSGNLLLSFSLVFFIGFMAFLHFGILIFGNGSDRYSSFLDAIYFQLELILGRVKARPINDLADVNEIFGKIFAGLLLVSLTIVGMNFFIATLNESLTEAKDTAVESGLYQLVNEQVCQSRKRDKMFFDVISEGLKKRKTDIKKAVLPFERKRKLNLKSKNRTDINFDLISKTIAASRQGKKGKKCFFEASDGTLKKVRRKRKGYGKMEPMLQSSSPPSKGVRFADDAIKSQFRMLQMRTKHLFQSFDDIIYGYSDEEEMFSLLCIRAVETFISDQP